MVDLSLVSGDGLRVPCHKVITVALGQYMDSLLRGSEAADQIILPDFQMNDICGLMNILYTGV